MIIKRDSINWVRFFLFTKYSNFTQRNILRKKESILSIFWIKEMRRKSSKREKFSMIKSSKKNIKAKILIPVNGMRKYSNKSKILVLTN